MASRISKNDGPLGPSLRHVQADRARLLLEKALEERGHLREMLLALWGVGGEQILRMRHALEHQEVGHDTGLAQLLMDAHRVAEKEVIRLTRIAGAVRREPLTDPLCARSTAASGLAVRAG